MEDMMQVIIGIDPHKVTHTAVAVDGSEDELSRLKVPRNPRSGREVVDVGVTVPVADVGDRGC